jgi:hypothetical protein
MSAMYSVFPLSAEIKLWLDEMSVEYPRSADGRNPQLAEIQAAFAQLKGYSVKESGAELGAAWQAFIQNTEETEENSWALLNILRLVDGPNEFYFEKGWPDLIVNITHLISRFSGPLVLICDSGGLPLVVSADSDPTALSEAWCT